MRIRASDHERLHGIMIGRGMPRALARVHGELHAGDLSACLHADSRPVPPQRQRAWLTQAMMEPSGDWVMCVGTRRDPDLVNLVGMEFFARATMLCIDSPAVASRPFWHQVVGGWGDRLRDDERRAREWRQESVGRIGALVIGGITVDCMGDKLEKCRDLVSLHEGIPRVLLIGGGDPFAFCMDRLNRRPERVVHLNRSRARADRSLA